jgi:hypothetical protein
MGVDAVSDLILAAVSFVALLAYATVGVAVGLVAEVEMRGRHTRFCNVSGNYPHAASRGCDCVANWAPQVVGVFGGILWPLAIVGLAVWCTVWFLAKGPTAWGSLIAAHLVGRSERKRVAAQEATERDARIAELEKELGVGS